MRATCCLLVLLSLSAGARAETRPARFQDLEIRGQVSVEPSGLVVSGKSALVVLHPAVGDAYRVTAEVALAEKGLPLGIHFFPQDAADANSPGPGRVILTRDKEGCLLTVARQHYDPDAKKWISDRDSTPLTFWPPAARKGAERLTADSGLAPRTWHDRPLEIVVEVRGGRAELWIEGLFFHQCAAGGAAASSPLALALSQGDRLASAVVRPGKPAADERFLTLDLSRLANEPAAAPLAGVPKTPAAPPFALVEGSPSLVSLRRACWIEEARDPGSYYENYDAGAPVLHDPRMVMLRVPSADYVAAHLLAVCDDDPQRTSALVLRAGRYGFSRQVVQYDFFADVPRCSGSAEMRVVRVPMNAAFAQDVPDYIDIELTKEIRLARRQPDPARFRWRPLGLPSGVTVAAITLERSALQMRVESRESGHAFVEPQQPEFQVKLTNITRRAQAYVLQAAATGGDRRLPAVRKSGRVEPGATAEVAIPLTVPQRGCYDLAVGLEDGAGHPLITRHTSFALLPPDSRRYREQSPIGTWDFSGAHFTCPDADRVGPLYVKAGLRFGMFGATPDERARWGVLPGTEPRVTTGLDKYEKALRPDGLPVGLIFHEDSISARHVTRAPDLFQDGPAYQLTPEEKERFDKLWEAALSGAKAVREKYPNVHLRMGNGPLPTKEEFYRRKFPAELFDSAGNECASMGRPPEAQPPDCVANNAGLWMDRQLLDVYGYAGKPVTQCYEICYPCTNPGNLDFQTQADYLVRHAMHSLAWGVPQFRPGCITDVGNSYRFSNWGATGLCRAYPEMNVKPAFVAVATLTRVLDGAKFARVVETPSAAVYLVEFQRADEGRAYVLWTLRGRRPLRVACAGSGWQQIDQAANQRELKPRGGRIEITATPTPQYLVGPQPITAVELGPPAYDDRPDGKATEVASLASLDDWQVQLGPDAELDHYNSLTPRRPGDFRFEPCGEFDGRQGVLRVAPRPIARGKPVMPMYASLVHRTGIALPGRPTEIGLWIHGNCGWGRIIYELQDAAGQRWISLGAQQSVEANPWLADWMPKEVLERSGPLALSDWNTEDAWGLSRINFDGWRYVAFPLPGNYPGENHPWPSVSQWRGGGDRVVHYPLTLKRLVVELLEKTLHVTRYEPVARPEIYLQGLTVAEGDPWPVKRTAGE